MLISRRAMAHYVDREFDDFTWMKKLPVEKLQVEIDSLRVPPKFKTASWHHQLVSFYIAMCQPRFLFLLDMGLGKTKILADIITQRRREKKLTRALVTVPRLINLDSWTDDLAVHSELEPWCVNAGDIEEKWERLAYPKGDITLVDYSSLHLAMCNKRKKKNRIELVVDQKKVDHLCKQFNFLGLDECHRLGNHNSLWWSILDQVSGRMDWCYGTTGTLFGKNVEAVWSQFHIVDRGETFGENLGLFRKTFFFAKNTGFGVKFVYDTGQDKLLNTMLRHRSLEYDETEVQELPERVSQVHYFSMTEEQRSHYLRAVEGLIRLEGAQSDMDAPWCRMRQVVSGYLAWKDDLGNHTLYFKENPKLQGLESLLESLGQKKLVISYEYTATGQMISDFLSKAKIKHVWLYGATKDKAATRQQFIQDSDVRVFLMNSESGGTGNDGLQKVCRHLLFFECPSSPTTRRQTLKRVHRPGQEFRTFIHDFVTRGSADVGILEGIQQSVDVYESVVRNNSSPRQSLSNLLVGKSLVK